MHWEKRDFGTDSSGNKVDVYTLTNKSGLRAEFTNFGGIIKSISVPDRKGKFDDVVLGFDTLDEYIAANPYFGCIAGRFANRIAHGRFTLFGSDYTVAKNGGLHHLHGGIQGFDKVTWRAAMIETDGYPTLTLRHLSKDGEEGYPGNLTTHVQYRLTNDDTLEIVYDATTDQPTIINLTNHTYFNLAGAGDILNHELQLNADRFTPVDETLIPTGEILLVSGTPLDFRQHVAIGARIDQDEEQLKYGNGYDHNFVINKGDEVLSLAAHVSDPISGRVLEVFTTQPGIQFYSGNFLTADIIGKRHAIYDRRSGFCLETQHYPDSPNQSSFPSVVLLPSDRYYQKTVFSFSA